MGSPQLYDTWPELEGVDSGPRWLVINRENVSTKEFTKSWALSE
jgi:hypothetical protein